VDHYLARLVIVALVKVILVIAALMTAAAYLVLVERWMAAWIQMRLGPNRVGFPLTKLRMFGLGQPMADGLKFIFKEEYTPRHVDRALFLLAPITILTAALAAFAVVPFGDILPEAVGITNADGVVEPIQLVVAPQVDVGMLYVFALGSIAVYGVILGGWASNNKYSFLGGLRSSAQLISYELPLGLGILGVVLMTGSLRLEDIMAAQWTDGWFFLVQPLGLIVFMVAAFAEAGRLPFDLPEAEQELVGGYHTEYSAIKLLLFLVAEFLHMIAASFLIVILFFGGWHLPFGLTGEPDAALTSWGLAILRIVVLAVKMLLVVLFFMLVRWSWPRFRFDQLMALAWKVMLPLGIVNLVAVAAINELKVSENAWFVKNFGPWQAETTMAVGWIVLVVSWLAVALAAPLITDNRPRRDVRSVE